MTSMTEARILIMDDHRVVAEGIAELLRPHFQVLRPVFDGEGLLAAVRRDAPDLILADIAMPGLSGIEALERLRAGGSTVPVMFLTMHAEASVARRAMEAGARGYVIKTMAGEELVRAIAEILSGGTYVSQAMLRVVIAGDAGPVLTARQSEVLRHLATGMRSNEIAERLGLSIRTVEAHRQALLQVFAVRNSVELVREAVRLGYLGTSR